MSQDKSVSIEKQYALLTIEQQLAYQLQVNENLRCDLQQASKDRSELMSVIINLRSELAKRST